MFGLGPMELIIIFLIILLVFGAKRIPEIAQGLGKGITEFKRAARDITDEFDTNKSDYANNSSSGTHRNELRGQQQRPVERPQERPQQEQPVENSTPANDDKQA